MTWWPPWRHRVKDNGQAAAAARQDAEDQKAAADGQTPHVERTVRDAAAAVRRANRFAAEVERVLKRGPA